MFTEVLKKLEAELAELDHELKITLPQDLATAAAHGDLSENAEYDAAKERKRMVESRISVVMGRIGDIKGIDINSIPQGRVGLGSTTVLEDVDSGEELTFDFVLPEQVDPDQNKISLASPIGKAVVGRSEGDEVRAVMPKGARTFEIVKLTTYHDKK